MWSSVLGIVLGVPGGQYQGEAESRTQQVNQGSYWGEIKDGGSQTSTSEKQPLTSTENRPVGAQTWNEMRMLGREPELVTGKDQRPGKERPQVGILLIHVALGKFLNLSVPPSLWKKMVMTAAAPTQRVAVGKAASEILIPVPGMKKSAPWVLVFFTNAVGSHCLTDVLGKIGTWGI